MLSRHYDNAKHVVCLGCSEGSKSRLNTQDHRLSRVKRRQRLRGTHKTLGLDAEEAKHADLWDLTILGGTSRSFAKKARANCTNLRKCCSFPAATFFGSREHYHMEASSNAGRKVNHHLVKHADGLKM